MSRKEGEPANFVIIKRFESGGKTYLPGEKYLNDVRTYKELFENNSESIFDLDSVEPKEKTLEELLEELDYDGRVEGMPIRLVILKQVRFRRHDLRQGDVIELPETTYREFMQDHKSHTYVVKMYAKDWIEEAKKMQEELTVRFDKIQELTGVDVRTEDNNPIYATLEKENIGENNKGGVSQDYYDLQYLEGKASNFESNLYSNKTTNTQKKPYIKRSSN